MRKTKSSRPRPDSEVRMYESQRSYFVGSSQLSLKDRKTNPRYVWNSKWRLTVQKLENGKDCTYESKRYLEEKKGD